MAAVHRKYKNAQNPEQCSEMINGLPKPFVQSMRTLFDIMDDDRTGYVKLVDIENRWHDDGGLKGMPSGVTESLRRVTPSNGLLTFEQFCAGLKLCLLKTAQGSNNVPSTTKYQRAYPVPSVLELSASNTIKPHWNNTAKVKPNNASIPTNHHQQQQVQQRSINLPKMSVGGDVGEREIGIRDMIPMTLQGPPKPPRLLDRNSRTTGADRAEIRNALQNWQIDVLMNDIDNMKNQSGCNSDEGTTVNSRQNLKTNKRREPRRHTLQNVIDLNILKRLKQYEEEKEVLRQGLMAVENARDWYLQQITSIQNKINCLGQTGAHVEQWSSSQMERLHLQRTRILELNRHLTQLPEIWDSGGFPMHMNLAFRQPPLPPPSTTTTSYNNIFSQEEIFNRLKQQNCQLLDEVSKRNDKILALDREKNELLKHVIQMRNAAIISSNSSRSPSEIVF